MVDYFGPGELPGGDVIGYSMDVATYQGIQRKADMLINACVTKAGELGWTKTGTIIYELL